MSAPWRLATLAAVALAVVLAWWGGAGEALSWPALGGRVQGWRQGAAAHPALAGGIYVIVYAGVVAASLPAGGVLSVLGGALFGAVIGGALALAAASSGAVLLFLLARATAGAWLARRAEPLIGRLRPSLERDGFAGLLSLRLLPVVPFWLGNLAPALVGMRLDHFVAATVLGIAPATFVLAGIGAGAGDVMARGQPPDLSALLSAPVLLPLTGLSLLALVPAAWRHWRRRA